MIALAITLVPSLSGQQAAPGQGSSSEEDSEEIYVLSPFSVTGDEDVGYQATNTLAGTRLKSDLKDLAGAVQVVTDEFLKDTGSVTAEDLFLFTTNTEASGPDGNFGNGGAERRNPDRSYRVRGLATPDLTRGYFLTDIGFDTYNTNRVTIAKGPNAILFGLGSPAGIVNNSLKQAVFKDQTEIDVRLASWGTHREVLDWNHVVVDDKLAIRLIGLNNSTKYKQKPSYSDEQRIYGALTATPFSQTTIRANAEFGVRDASRPDTSSPTTNVTGWINDGMPTADDPTNGAGFSGMIQNRAPQFLFLGPDAQQPSLGWDPWGATVGPDGIRRQMFTAANREDDAGSGLSQGVLSDNDLWLFDFRNNSLTGLDNTQDMSFGAVNVAIEQTFGRNAGVEVAYDHQYYDLFSRDRSSNLIRVDVSEYLPYYVSDGAGGVELVPNENVRRPYLHMWENMRGSETEREAFRVTAFYDLDFRENDKTPWLGRHVFTGLFSHQSREVLRYSNQYGSSITGEMQDVLEANRNRDFTAASWDRRMAGKRYLGPAITGIPTNGEPLVSRVSTITPRINQFNAWMYDSTAEPIRDGDKGAYREVTGTILVDPITSASLDRQEINSFAITAQSYLLDDHIVATYGWRQDEAKSWRDGHPDQTVDNIAIVESLELPDTPDDVVKDDVFTWGVVGHRPTDWLFDYRLSVHYGESSNFVPSPGRITLLNEPHPSPAGETTEYGFSLETPNRKLYVRVNWYETFSQNQTDNSLGPGNIPNWERLFYNNARNSLQELEEKVPGDPSQGYWPNNRNWAEVYTLPPLGMRQAFWTPVEPDPGPGGTPSVSDHPNPNVTGVSDFQSKGMEIEGVWNPTRNWTIAFNAARQEVIKTNVLRSYLKYFELREPGWIKMGDLIARPNTYKRENPQTIFERTRNVQWKRLLAETEKEGAISPEVREWRFNLVTNYRFGNDGPLKGWSVGGAWRWQDNAAVGFRSKTATGDELGIAGLDQVDLVDVDNPIYGPKTGNIDVWFAYRRKLFDGKVDWKIQLNVRNLLNNDDLIPTKIDPDGVWTRVRIVNPINFRLANTFTF